MQVLPSDTLSPAPLSSLPTETVVEPTRLQPSPTSTHSPAPTQTPTSTLTPYPTLPPLPTLPLSERDAEIQWLMTTNKHCRLPCWWGLVPGESSIQEAVQFFQRLGGYIDVQPAHSESIDDFYYISLHNPGTDDSFGCVLGVDDGVIQNISTDGDINRYSFQIRQLLAEYGAPTEVFIREVTYLSEEERTKSRYDGYEIVLLYAEDHFFVEYNFGAEKYQETHHACSGTYPRMEIWSDGEDRNASWFQNNLNKMNKNPFFGIEEISAYNPSTFRTQVLESGGDPCFELNYAAIRSRTLGISFGELAPTLTITPTPTPVIEYPQIPTLQAAEASAYYQRLYRQRPDCPTPCWWGLVPGETTMLEVHEILGPFSSPQHIRDEVFEDEKGQLIIESSASWAADLPYGHQATWEVWSRDQIASRIRFSASDELLPLSRVFEDYGKPDVIGLIFIPPYFGEAVNNGQLMLYYKEQRAFFSYFFDLYEYDQVYRGCGASLWFMDHWSKEEDSREIEELQDTFFGGTENTIQSNLEELTGWSVETFYQTYRDAENGEICITIPHSNY